MSVWHTHHDTQQADTIETQQYDTRTTPIRDGKQAFTRSEMMKKNKKNYLYPFDRRQALNLLKVTHLWLNAPCVVALIIHYTTIETKITLETGENDDNAYPFRHEMLEHDNFFTLPT